MSIFGHINRLVLASATLVGTIVGVGLFGLPYIAARAGIVPVVFYLVFLGGVVTFLHLIYGEVVLRTEHKHRLTGYAGHYLGRGGKVLAGGAFFFGIYGALLAYLVIGGQFLSVMVSRLFPAFTPFWGTILLASVGFVIVLKGIRSVGFFEVLMTAVLLSLILGLLVYGTNFISLDNIVLWGSRQVLLLPYGVVLFSLWGTSAIPEIREFFGKRPQNLKKAIITGTIVPIIIAIIYQRLI